MPSVADAATGPAITGTATPTTTAPGGVVTMGYSITTDSAYTAASVIAVPSTSLTFVPGSVTVDAVPQPAITPAAGALTIPTPDEPVAATHLVTFQVTTATTAATAVVSAAAFRYTDATHLTGNTINAAPVVVDPPNLSLAVGPTGAPTELKLGRGDVGALGVILENHGGAAAGALAVVLPASLAMFENDIQVNGDDVVCAASLATPGQLSCPLGVLGAATRLELVIPFTTTRSAVVGDSGALTFAVAPTNPAITDAVPGDNAVTIPFAIVASPHTVATISTSKLKVTVGQKQILTLTVRNDGPGVVDAGVGLVALENDDFNITAFDGKEISDAGILATSPAIAQLTHLDPAKHSAIAHNLADKAITQATDPSDDGSDPGHLRAWDLGSLAAGQSIVAHLTVQAVTAGAMQLAVVPLTSPGDPSCDLTGDALPACVALVSLRAVAPVAAPVVPAAVHHSATPTATATASLAATGSRSTLPTLLGLAMLLAGAAAIRLGRRRA
ncbi:MAG: hypothetical protein JWN95_1063 [Frankiales bacterium]|nr:hypothetical protein [Frankiales bacterium]